MTVPSFTFLEAFYYQPPTCATELTSFSIPRFPYSGHQFLFLLHSVLPRDHLLILFMTALVLVLILVLLSAFNYPVQTLLAISSYFICAIQTVSTAQATTA